MDGIKGYGEEMFEFNEESELFEVELQGVRVVCDELFDGCEESAKELAACYDKKLPEIAAYMLSEDIEAYYGKLSVETIVANLKTPQIDVGRCLLTYLEHTLDDMHIIEIEFDGVMDEFLSMSING